MVLVAACSGSAPPAFPPAPEPAVAPPLAQTPAGTVVPFAGDRSLPEGVAADPKTGIVGVALRNPDRLALLQGSTLRLRRIVSVPGRARHLVLEKPGGPLLLPGEDTDLLVRVALPSGAVIGTTRLGRQPHNACYADGRIYVANELGSSVAVVNAETGHLLRTLPGPLQPGGTAVTGGTLSAVDVRSGRLYTWNVRTLAATGWFSIGSGPTHEADVGHGLLAVNDTRGDATLLVAPATHQVISRLDLPGVPYGIAADPATGRVWVTLTARNQVVQLAVSDERLSVVRRWSTVRQPNTVAFDPNADCLYIAGDTPPELERICHLP